MDCSMYSQSRRTTSRLATGYNVGAPLWRKITRGFGSMDISETVMFFNNLFWEHGWMSKDREIVPSKAVTKEHSKNTRFVKNGVYILESFKKGKFLRFGGNIKGSWPSFWRTSQYILAWSPLIRNSLTYHFNASTKMRKIRNLPKPPLTNPLTNHGFSPRSAIPSHFQQLCKLGSHIVRLQIAHSPVRYAYSCVESG